MSIPRDPEHAGPPGWSEEDQRLRASMTNEVPPRPANDPFMDRLQVDPVLYEGHAGFSRVAIYAAAAALIICAVIYGMGSQRPGTTATNPPPATASNPQPSSTAQNAPMAAPPVRNVTPGPNTQQGVTTGAAQADQAPPKPATPAASESGNGMR